MKNYRTRAIVIKRTNFNEADRLLWLLTRDRGLVKVKARGVRKIQAKLKGLLELFVLSDIELVKGRSLDVVTGGKQIESYDNLRNDLEATSIAFYFSELVIEFLTEEEQSDAYDLFISALDSLNKEKNKLLIVRFLVNLLSLSGYSPELTNCLNCSEKVANGGNKFDFVQGGVVCSSCQSDASCSIDDNAIKLIRLIIDGRNRIKVDQKHLIQAEKILEKFVEEIIEKRIKSRSFLTEVGNA